MNVNKIEAGDKVDLFRLKTSEDPIFNMTVLHVSQATGDSWTLKSMTNRIYEVQNFEMMILSEKRQISGKDYKSPEFQTEENMK